MSLGKQAKTLSKGQTEAVLGYLATTRWPTRNRVIFLLSVKAGLRAKEIASLTWRMVTDPRGQIGQAIYLENAASKGQSGRAIPMNGELRTALAEYAKTIWMPTSTFLIASERSRGCRLKPSSICFGAGIATSASMAAPATAGGGRSSRTPRGRFRRWEDHFGTSRCWPGIQTSGLRISQKRDSGFAN